MRERSVKGWGPFDDKFVTLSFTYKREYFQRRHRQSDSAYNSINRNNKNESG